MQNRLGKLPAFLQVQFAHFQEDARKDFLVQFCFSRGRQGSIFPLQPARGIDEGAVFFGKARAWQAVDRGLDLLHLALRDARRLPEFAGFVGVNFSDHQPIGFLQGFDILVRIGANGHAVHAEREQPLDVAAVHVVPDVGPGVVAVDLG